MRTFFKRMLGAARFDACTYEQIEADRAGTPAAILVVLIASVAAAIGLGATSFRDLIGLTVGAFLSWMVWVGLTLVIGKWVMPEFQTHTTVGEIVRTTGFSASPGVLRILVGIPGIGLPILIGVTMWMVFTFVAAIRSALDYATFRRAAAVCVLAWLIHGLLFFAFVRIVI